MDNASKALIMAGGILLAVMIISVSLYVIASARGVAKASNERIEANAVQSFNRFYVAYGSLPTTTYSIKGVDALNIYRKAVDDNTREAQIHVIDITDVSTEIAAASDAIDSGNNITGAEIFKSSFNYAYEVDGAGYVSKIIISN